MNETSRKTPPTPDKTLIRGLGPEGSYNYKRYSEEIKRTEITLDGRKHHELCEGDLICPNTGRQECIRVTIFKGTPFFHRPAQVYCFGCGESHRVEE